MRIGEITLSLLPRLFAQRGNAATPVRTLALWPRGPIGPSRAWRNRLRAAQPSFTGDGLRTKVRAQCWSVADMLTSPLLGVCWLPNSGVFSIENSKFFVWNRQCFLTIGPVQQAPYVGFWNSFAIFQPSRPFTMETRYEKRSFVSFLFSGCFAPRVCFLG